MKKTIVVMVMGLLTCTLGFSQQKTCNCKVTEKDTIIQVDGKFINITKKEGCYLSENDRDIAYAQTKVGTALCTIYKDELYTTYGVPTGEWIEYCFKYWYSCNVAPLQKENAVEKIPLK